MFNYIIYETTNTVNNKIYVGKHKQKGIEFDGYLGSGKVLNQAIQNMENNYLPEKFFLFLIMRMMHSKKK